MHDNAELVRKLEEALGLQHLDDTCKFFKRDNVDSAAMIREVIETLKQSIDDGK